MTLKICERTRIEYKIALSILEGNSITSTAFLYESGGTTGACMNPVCGAFDEVIQIDPKLH